MTNKIEIKTGPAKVLRQTLRPFAIIGIVLSLIWIYAHSIILCLSSEAEIASKKWFSAVQNIGCYVAAGAVILILITGLILMAHSVLQLLRVRKNNIVTEVGSGAFNAIVSILIVVFAILCLVTVFNREKWYAGNIYQKGAYMGILLALAVYANYFAKVFNWVDLQKRNDYVRMVRVIGIAIFTMSMLAIVPLLLMPLGAMKHVLDIKISNTKTIYIYVGIASAVAAKYLVAITGVAAVMLCTTIPFIIFGVKENKALFKKNMIFWPIIAGVALALFIAAAVLMILNGNSHRWFDSETKSAICALMVLISWVATVATGALAKDDSINIIANGK